MSHRQAILESVRNRIRPIFMTTATTVFGLSPLVFFPGAGSELYRGLGAVVLGGLVVSTIFTLLLVPTLFSLMMDLRDWLTPASPRVATPIEPPLDLEPEMRILERA
jgi:HAE1 family hydrophobic/amphiphilic exporter-1